MTSGPEHYKQAEQLLAWASDAERGSAHEVSLLTEAQIHATLAQAAATALAAFHQLPVDDCDAWTQVAGVAVPGEQLAPVRQIGGR